MRIEENHEKIAMTEKQEKTFFFEILIEFLLFFSFLTIIKIVLLRLRLLFQNRIYYQYFKETDIGMKYICYYISV